MTTQPPANTPQPEFWFRYEDQSYSVCIDPDHEIFSTSHEMRERIWYPIRKTPKGVWLIGVFGDPWTWYVCNKNITWLEVKERWIVKPKFIRVGTKKQFAHPDKWGALKAYKSRKNRQISIYLARIRAAETFISQADRALDRLAGMFPNVKLG